MLKLEKKRKESEIANHHKKIIEYLTHDYSLDHCITLLNGINYLNESV